MDYPDKPLYNEDKDEAGRSYKNAYSNKDTNCVLALNKYNYVFKGRPKIAVRNGNSKFGDEIIFTFKIDGKTYDKYEINSVHNLVEFYLPLDEGLQFLKDAIKHFESAGGK